MPWPNWAAPELSDGGFGWEHSCVRTAFCSCRVCRAQEVADGADDAVRLVIADCLSGARIGHEAWPAGTGSEELIAAIVAAVEQTQRRFPEGVARIVGVSHFLSRNLVHDFDHRQAGYAYLLQHALALHPGTAVLEIEEDVPLLWSCRSAHRTERRISAAAWCLHLWTGNSRFLWIRAAACRRWIL